MPGITLTGISPELDAELDAAAADISGRPLTHAAELVWLTLQTLTEPDVPAPVRFRCAAIVQLGMQVTPIRDWVLLQAALDPESGPACAEVLSCLAATAPPVLVSRLAGAAGMLMAAYDHPVIGVRRMLALAGDDSLGQLVQCALIAEMPARAIRRMLTESAPMVTAMLQSSRVAA